MIEILVGTAIGLSIGAAFAWLLRGAQSKAAQAAIDTQLAMTREQHAAQGTEFNALKNEHAGCPEMLAVERERRAAVAHQETRHAQRESRLHRYRRSNPP